MDVEIKLQCPLCDHLVSDQVHFSVYAESDEDDRQCTIYCWWCGAELRFVLTALLDEVIPGPEQEADGEAEDEDW